MPSDLVGTEAAALIARIAELEQRLQESEDTLDAIRCGEVDALVMGGTQEQQRVYTLETADRPYRVLIEQIQEGTITLGIDGMILYCNRRLALMLGLPQERIIGQMLRPLIAPEDGEAFDRLLDDAQTAVTRRELSVLAAGGHAPAGLSVAEPVAQRGWGAAAVRCADGSDGAEAASAGAGRQQHAAARGDRGAGTGRGRAAPEPEDGGGGAADGRIGA